MAAGSLALLAIVLAAGLGPAFGAYVGGLALGCCLLAGITLRVDGPVLVSDRFGFSRRVPLDAISRVERSTSRGGISLRLWQADGRHAPSIPITALAYRLDPVVAAHLVRYLDRPEVSWGPGAWEALAVKVSPSTALGSPSVPRGSRVPRRPVSRWAKAAACIYVPLVIASVALLIVLSTLSWIDYSESQRIQHGRETVAVLQREWVTVTSDRYGTHHATHFQVVYVTNLGRPIQTVINAHGLYNPLPAGDRFPIRFDPSSPANAELPGVPQHTLKGAITITAITTVCMFVLLGTVLVIRQARRRRAYATTP